MKKRKLRNLEVNPIGMGCMGFSHGYGEIPTEEYSIQAIRKGIKTISLPKQTVNNVVTAFYKSGYTYMKCQNKWSNRTIGR